uniref:Uncharacterized protein n=1 Tax=Anguilla anguilla TaxID=7936 RepID=A0A0E9R5P0_ANGAN
MVCILSSKWSKSSLYVLCAFMLMCSFSKKKECSFKFCDEVTWY